jgi:hypothetical protein
MYSYQLKKQVEKRSFDLEVNTFYIYRQYMYVVYIYRQYMYVVYIYRQYMYVVYILQCQKVQKQLTVIVYSKYYSINEI